MVSVRETSCLAAGHFLIVCIVRPIEMADVVRCRCLLGEGRADVNRRDAQGDTPLTLAVRVGFSCSICVMNKYQLS